MKGLGWLGLAAGLAGAEAGPRRLTGPERDLALAKQKFSNTMRMILNLEASLEKCKTDPKQAERIKRKIENYEKELVGLKADLGFATEPDLKHERAD